MATPEELEEFKKENSEVVAKGIALYAQKQEELEGKYPAGHVVIINVDTGEYVVAKTIVDVIKIAEATFGDSHRGYIRNIVGPHPLVEFGGCPL